MRVVPYFGFESVVLLRQVLFSVMVVITLPVSPLEVFVLGDVDVLKVVIWSVAPVFGLGNGDLREGGREAYSHCRQETNYLSSKSALV